MSPRARNVDDQDASRAPAGGAPEPDAPLVAAQIGRVPRAPWRVAARCRSGYPTVIVSPSQLIDGTPFPTFAWLTCPWLSERASASESQGEAAEWARQAAADEELRSRLAETDRAVRARRAAESDGMDACASVGIAGQQGLLGVKCLHAHLALALVGIEDPIGMHLLARADADCPDRRCARLTQDASLPDGGMHAKEGA